MTPACKEIRRNILRASRASGHGHIPTTFSVVEMLCAVYETMKYDPAQPQWPERDLFVLSKGHAALGFYTVLAQYGFIKPDELKTYGAFQSRLGCHPDRFKVPGVELSTGSLGHGVAVAVGMALALRIQNSPRRVYTLVGDGESNEGMVWESVMVAANLRLANLAILYDNNGSQSRSLPIPNPAERFRAFKCETLEVAGHDLEAIKAALAKPADTVKVVVCNTVKGCGCPTLANNMFEWHRKSPNPEQFEQLMKELEAA
ncbi:MAG TPA: transketolase [Candidatus Paceibacterota bacterium]|nr:transketolase [Verrucomicrobiota bacterium]HSA12065.1 transketolase [Candidatus Paceibacterota bacterium]